MPDVREHDRRQLSRLRERLDLFTSGGIPLRAIVADVEFLLSVLEVDQSLHLRLKREWEVLEEVYSVSRAMGRELTAEDDALVCDAVTALRAVAEEMGGGGEPEEPIPP